MNDKEQRPVIFVDQRKKRIRIHKVTLRMLGNPAYIQILINPVTMSLAIKSCDKKARLALRVPKRKNDCCDLYSTNLVKLFYGICSKWDNFSQYRLYGKYVSLHNLAYFKMEDGRIYNEQEGSVTAYE